MKVYNTKYALTDGIKEVEVETFTFDTQMVKLVGSLGYLHGEGLEWHRTFESAVAKAELMRLKKILSLNKALKKLHALEFSKVKKEIP